MAYTNYYSAGAVAEQVVHTKLKALPSDYCVFQNIDAGTGESFTELDFAVVTPTGASFYWKLKPAIFSPMTKGNSIATMPMVQKASRIRFTGKT